MPMQGSDQKNLSRLDYSTAPISLTPDAIRAAKEALSKEGDAQDGLRVAIAGGGCSGYQYCLDFERTARMGDIVFTADGLTIYLDPISAGYLQGTVIDFVDREDGRGFHFDNPNPRKRMCGCGSATG